MYCHRLVAKEVYCHRLVAKEVCCNITCRLKKLYCNTPLCIVNKKDLELRNVLQYNFCIVTNSTREQYHEQ